MKFLIFTIIVFILVTIGAKVYIDHTFKNEGIYYKNNYCPNWLVDSPQKGCQ
jgi:hypothetical protein